MAFYNHPGSPVYSNEATTSTPYSYNTISPDSPVPIGITTNIQPLRDWVLGIRHPDGRHETINVSGYQSTVELYYAPELSYASMSTWESPPYRRVSIPIPQHIWGSISQEGFVVTTLEGPISPYPNQAISNTPIDIPSSVLTQSKLIDLLKENVEVRTKLDLSGTDLTVTVQMIIKDGDNEVVVSEDEDSVDLEDILSL